MTHRTGAGATINPDNIVMFRIAAVLVGVVFLASAITSSFGLYAVGLAQGLPPLFAWTTPVMIDVAIVVFTMVAMIQKRRGNMFARLFASFSVALAALLSVGLNFLHSYYEIGVADLASATGTGVNTIAPLFIWVTTEMLVMLVTKTPPVTRAVPVPRTSAARSKAKTSAKKAQQKRVGPTKSADAEVESPSRRPSPTLPVGVPTPARSYERAPTTHAAPRAMRPPRPAQEPVHTLGER